MSWIVSPAAIVAAIALLAGLMLALAAKYLSVSQDEKLSLVRALLPGANCGACGCAGCDDYAAKMVNEGAPINLCIPGGEDAMRKIGRTLGKDAAPIVPMTAIVACSRKPDPAALKMDYEGRKSCLAVSMFYKGDLNCAQACLGYGDCVSACRTEAISIKDGIASIDKKRCIGCGKCVSVCPQNTIYLWPQKAHIHVACLNPNRGQVTRKQCSSGCIDCHRCEKVCPTGAIYFREHIAWTDPDLCIQCGACVKACPVGVIHSCFIDQKSNVSILPGFQKTPEAN